MTKKKSKYRRVFIIIAMSSLVLFNTGCFLFNRSAPNVKREINVLGNKVDLIFDSMESLNETNHVLEEKLLGLMLEKEMLREEHVQITNNQLTIKSLHELQKTELGFFREELLAIRNSILEIRRDMVTFYKLSKRKKDVSHPKDIVKGPGKVEEKPTSPKVAAKKTEDTEKSKNNGKKNTQDGQKPSTVEKMYNRAKTLYRQGKYKEAIAKWEEVLEIDPTILDAMYNIEVAKERIKE